MAEIMTVVCYIVTALTFLKFGVSGFKWVRRRFFAKGGENEVRHILQIKRELEQNLRWVGPNRVQGEAIIRNVKDSSPYPDGDVKERGVRCSNWFKVEIKGLYHNGLEVFTSRAEVLRFDSFIESWKKVNGKESNKDFMAWEIGRIPFKNIKSLDWKGDEYYPFLHIYCSFNGPLKMPCEDFKYYYEVPYSDCLYPIDDYRPWETDMNLLQKVALRIRVLLNI